MQRLKLESKLCFVDDNIQAIPLECPYADDAAMCHAPNLEKYVCGLLT